LIKKNDIDFYLGLTAKVLLKFALLKKRSVGQ